MFSIARGQVKKHARKNDVATDYILKPNGDLFRTVKGHPCQITTKVLEMKVSGHPDDVAMLYYIKDDKGSNNLYVLLNAESTGQCPKATTNSIMSGVKKIKGKFKYTVVPTIHTTIVNMALSERGSFRAWEKNSVVVSEEDVQDFTMHQNFNVKGRPFSTPERGLGSHVVVSSLGA